MENKAHIEVKKALGLDIPEYVDNLYFESERLMGLMAYLRFDVPINQFDDLLNISPLFPKDVSDKVEPIDFSVYNDQSDWWKPEELTNPKFGETYGNRAKWTTSSYMACRFNQDSVQVYFMYFEEP